MGDIMIVENGVRPDGLYCLKMMANHRIEDAELPVKIPDKVSVIRSKDATGVHELKASWRMRGPCQIVIGDWRRTVVLWALEKGDRVSEAALQAAQIYLESFCAWPEFAWVSSLPKGIENAAGIYHEGREELMVFQADFIPPGFVAVGSGGLALTPCPSPDGRGE